MDAGTIQSMLRSLIPMLDSMEIEIQSVSDEEIVSAIPLSRQNKNHIGTVYAGTQFSLGEATGGVLLLRNHPGTRILVTEAKIAYLDKASTALHARAGYPAGDRARVTKTLQSEGKTVYVLHVDILDKADATVSRMEIGYHLRVAR